MNRAEAFQTAVELSDRGKHEDDARNYPTALPLYQLAMDYYLQALKVEPNADIKKGIRDRMKLFLDRAEQLKPVVAQMGGSAPINIVVSSAPRTPSNALPIYSNNGGTCAACGGVLLGSSLTAMDRVWHPECFVGNVMCAGCMQPFAINNLLMKMKDGKPYHPMCFEGTTGLSKEEVRSFLGTSGQLVFKVDMPKKFFSPGEQFQFHFKIDNYTSYKINRVVAYLIKTETHMEIMAATFERKAKTNEVKLGRTEFFQSNFPLGKGNFEGDFSFTLPPNLHPSEVTGVDASFVREYELVAKCVLTKPLNDVKATFQVKVTSATG